MASPKRNRLPDTRASVTHKFRIGDEKFYVTVGLYEDGNPGEVFITSEKGGSTLSGFVDSFAIALSLGLQYGVPLQAIVDKFKHMRFEPAGFTQGNEIRSASSVVDYIAQWLEKEFLLKEKK